MRLTDAEIAYTRQVAAEIGADPEELIAEGEAIKEGGYRQAYQASAQIMADIQGATRAWASAPHPAAESRAEPELMAAAEPAAAWPPRS